MQAICGIINGGTAMTAATAKQLAVAFGTSAEVWLNLETGYRLAMAEEQALAESGSSLKLRSRRGDASMKSPLHE